MIKHTVAVGMSGGVDSSYTAYSLIRQGFDVTGISMSVFSGKGTSDKISGHACYGPSEQEDIEAAQQVCRALEIPHRIIDVKKAYQKEVIQYFTSEYLCGRTPNPCTRCNPVIKFGHLLAEANRSGIQFDFFATGHYARIEFSDKENRYVLKKGLDRKKDQSYFLYALNPDLLHKLKFPLGELTKQEVRKLAEQAELPVAQRKESQDFIEGGDYSQLFKSHQIKPGPILDDRGNQLGTHTGIVNYTIGQRRGLGISGKEPLYVIQIDAANNAIVVGERGKLHSHTLIADHLHFLSIDPPQMSIRIKAKIRYNTSEEEAVLFPLENQRVKLVFQRPLFAITEGQAVVFYDQDVVLGGGTIKNLT